MLEIYNNRAEIAHWRTVNLSLFTLHGSHGYFGLKRCCVILAGTACRLCFSFVPSEWLVQEPRFHLSHDPIFLSHLSDCHTEQDHTEGAFVVVMPHQRKWFAVYTTPRHEKSVARHLTQRQIEHFLPLYQSKRKWKDGSNITLELPLFPGYLFVCIQKDERIRVLDIPGILLIVGNVKTGLSEIPDHEIEALRMGLEYRKAKPHDFLQIGQKVRIVHGALTGLEGVLVRNGNVKRVVLTVESIMRSFSVEVNADEVLPF